MQLCVRFLHPRMDGEVRQIASSLLAAATRKRAIPKSSPWEAPTSRFRALVWTQKQRWDFLCFSPNMTM